MASKDILDQKVGRITIGDGFAIGGAKLGSELAFEGIKRIVPIKEGWQTSIAKIGVASVGSMVTSNNRVFQYATTGMLIDGMEDGIIYLKNLIMNGGNKRKRSADVAAFA